MANLSTVFKQSLHNRLFDVNGNSTFKVAEGLYDSLGERRSAPQFLPPVGGCCPHAGQHKSMNESIKSIEPESTTFRF